MRLDISPRWDVSPERYFSSQLAWMPILSSYVMLFIFCFHFSFELPINTPITEIHIIPFTKYHSPHFTVKNHSGEIFLS